MKLTVTTDNGSFTEVYKEYEKVVINLNSGKDISEGWIMDKEEALLVAKALIEIAQSN